MFLKREKTYIQHELICECYEGSAKIISASDCSSMTNEMSEIALPTSYVCYFLFSINAPLCITTSVNECSLAFDRFM